MFERREWRPVVYRKCTDTLWLLLFSLFWAGLVSFGPLFWQTNQTRVNGVPRSGKPSLRWHYRGHASADPGARWDRTDLSGRAVLYCSVCNAGF